MPTLYLVCGIPLSGKTSVSKEIAVRENAVTLSYQEIKYELFGPDIRGERDKEVYGALNSLFGKALDRGRNIVVDSINGVPAVRRRYAKLAIKRGYQTVCVFCHKHYAYAITANQIRGDGRYRDGDIKNAFDKFIPPERYEGWNDIRVMDGNRYSLEVEGQIPIERRSAPGKRAKNVKYRTGNRRYPRADSQSILSVQQPENNRP